MVAVRKIGKFVPDTLHLSRKRLQEECGCKRWFQRRSDLMKCISIEMGEIFENLA